MNTIVVSAARRSWLFALRPGAHVRRLLGGSVPMDLIVTEVTAQHILCGPEGVGWMFDRETGAEVDEEIGWGPRFGRTGSYLVPLEDMVGGGTVTEKGES